MAEKTPEEINELVKKFRKWINTQPQLPNDLEDKLLRRFLHGCHYDLEKTKNAFKIFISVREQCPELLCDRDPLSPQVQKMFTFLKQAQIMLPRNRKLWIWKLDDPGMLNFDSFQDAKMFFIITDMWLLFDDVLEDEDIILTDTKDIVSLRFFYSKFSFSIARRMIKYQQEALPVRLKQIHIVNTPPFIDRLFTWIKPFLKKEITDMMHFHTPNSDTLYNYFSKDELPEDYGGTLAKIDDRMQDFVEEIVSKREYFLKNDLWKVKKEDEEKCENINELKEGLSLTALTID
ncbi:unnamed protein product [Chilo suppressalis]|uniref:CRAL-TRIO domain-containing protein n=1 Tax=Chilo suppressalis TaxID=168631 RepID=A0ABN8L231_CHISP|nr:hypothetical protein evm_008847 [Chilo suppressalis]CAH2982135.1 unnamed protein product [Chilo suppressalis]